MDTDFVARSHGPARSRELGVIRDECRLPFGAIRGNPVVHQASVERVGQCPTIFAAIHAQSVESVGRSYILPHSLRLRPDVFRTKESTDRTRRAWQGCTGHHVSYRSDRTYSGQRNSRTEPGKRGEAASVTMSPTSPSGRIQSNGIHGGSLESVAGRFV